MPKTDFFAGPEGVAKSLDEYDAFVENGLYTDDFLKSAATEIHGAQYGDAWWGKMNPVSITQATDGTVVISKNNGIIGKKSRAKAKELFGDKAIIAGGRGANFDTVKWGIDTPSPNHAEARGLHALLKRGIDPTNARQATTLPSCRDCGALQRRLRIINLTGEK